MNANAPNIQLAGRRWKRACLFIAIAIVLIVAIAPVCLVESNHWVETVDLRSGQKLTIEQRLQVWRYFGLPHQGGFGGGTISHSISCQFDCSNWRFEAPFIPIVLQPDHDQLYLAVFDRDTDSRKCRFRFYRVGHLSEPVEIPASEFPKQLAIQNMWLEHDNGFVTLPDGKTHVIDEYEIVAKLDPSDVEFRDSLTARVWQRLELGQEYYATEGEEADQAFLEDYKKKYITNASSAPAR